MRRVSDSAILEYTHLVNSTVTRDWEATDVAAYVKMKGETMTHVAKTVVLVALGGATVCLSLALAGLSDVQAETAPRQDAWIADDAAQAVRTLLNTSSFTPLDHASVPGSFRSAPADLKFKALGSKPAGVKISSRDGSTAYLAAPEKSKVPYETKNAFPKILWSPKIQDGQAAVQLKGKGGTTFVKLDDKADTLPKKTTFKPVIMDRGTKKADTFAMSLKSDEKTGKMAVTTPQLKAFKERIKTAKQKSNGSASALFAGSLGDQPATFVPIVRVRGGTATDFRITAAPVR
jgi:hypothetical protein